MKTELEEVAKNFIPKSNKWTIKDIFIDGANWMQERMYSEEDMKHAFLSGCQSERQIKQRVKCCEEFIEKFKKK